MRLESVLSAHSSLTLKFIKLLFQYKMFLESDTDSVKGTPDIRSVPALLFLLEDLTIVKPQVYLKGLLVLGFILTWIIFC